MLEQKNEEGRKEGRELLYSTLPTLRSALYVALHYATLRHVAPRYARLG